MVCMRYVTARFVIDKHIHIRQRVERTPPTVSGSGDSLVDRIARTWSMAEEQQKPDSPGLDSPADDTGSQQGALLQLLGELRAELDRILASLPASAAADVTSSQESIGPERDDSRSDKTDDPQD